MPNGTVAPGKVWPIRWVPTIGLTYCNNFSVDLWALAARAEQANMTVKILFMEIMSS
jgi:hypothetical protein